MSSQGRPLPSSARAHDVACYRQPRMSVHASPAERRVLHIVPALFGPKDVRGGAERYALELARNMADRVPTTLLTFARAPRDEQHGSLRIKVLAGWYVRNQRFNPFSLGLVPEVLAADIVHCHQQHIVASSAAAIVSHLGRKRVFVSDLGGGGWDISSYVSTDRWYHGHLHISEYSRRVFGHMSNPRAHVIYGGVDVEKFRPGQRDGSHERQALFVGRLLPHKGINDLIEAAPPKLPVQIVGEPSDAVFLGDLHRLAEGKKIAFRHGCSDGDIVDAYQRALCIVLPSVYRTMYGAKSRVPELLGQTLLEGMACGVPAICTDVASMPEIVENGVTGFVVPANEPLSLREKLIWLTEHPANAAKMGAAGRRRVLDRFTWDRVVARCLEIYGLSDSSSLAMPATSLARN